MSPVDLRLLEQQSFLEWRRKLAKAEESEYFILTPFERNLEIWRQLWRVIEHCDLLVQIVDARNPLLFFCDDLINYALELDPRKKSLLLINKADYLTFKQRKEWSRYFSDLGINHAFYSAAFAQELSFEHHSEQNSLGINDDVPILSRQELLEFLRHSSISSKVGFVGYPNVGKSSTINTLAGSKRVAVAAAPGKTKHFQTIILENDIILYDCPGLVFPNMSSSKAELVLNGILVIDQLREWVKPIELIMNIIPTDILEKTYGVVLENQDSSGLYNPITAHTLLSSVAKARGFMTSLHGNPDESRAARIILKDFVKGKLCFCYPPPSIVDAVFNEEVFDQMRAKLREKKLRGIHNLHTQDTDILVSQYSQNFFLHPTIQSAPTKMLPGKKHFKGTRRTR